MYANVAFEGALGDGGGVLGSLAENVRQAIKLLIRSGSYPRVNGKLRGSESAIYEL